MQGRVHDIICVEPDGKYCNNYTWKSYITIWPVVLFLCRVRGWWRVGSPLGLVRGGHFIVSYHHKILVYMVYIIIRTCNTHM